MKKSFDALVLRQEERKTTAAIEKWNTDHLPDHEVLVEVSFSTVNYKDALAVTGRGKIVRQFPFIPGIDLSGTVVDSRDEAFTAGDKVILTGWGVGEKHFGGLAKYARLKSKWLLPLPEKLSEKSAMMSGTAGLTAALCVLKLIDSGVKKEHGAVVVSGASGGVGSFCVMLLAALGFEVHAVSRPESEDYLRSLGVRGDILERSGYAAEARPLEASRWAAGIDTVGNRVLARMIAEADYGAIVTACGLAGGFELPATVMPFILRGVTLIGVESVYAPNPLRKRAWQLIVDHLDEQQISRAAAHSIGLEEVPSYCEKLLAGEHQGRALVCLQKG